MFDNIRSASFRPDRDLVYRRRTERVRRADNDLFAAFGKTVRKFAYRGGFSDAVDTYDKNDRRFCRNIQVVAAAHGFGDYLRKRRFDAFRIVKIFEFRLFAEFVYNALRGLVTDVRHNKQFQKFFEKVLVNFSEHGKDGIEALAY